MNLQAFMCAPGPSRICSDSHYAEYLIEIIIFAPFMNEFDIVFASFRERSETLVYTSRFAPRRHKQIISTRPGNDSQRLAMADKAVRHGICYHKTSKNPSIASSVWRNIKSHFERDFQQVACGVSPEYQLCI